MPDESSSQWKDVYKRQAYSEKRAQMRAIQMKAYLNQQQEIRHQEAVIEKLKSFNREKSIKRAESREKMLDKIEVLEKPTEVNDAMDIRLEPNILSGNDVLTVNGLAKSFGSQTLFTDLSFDVKRGERVAIIGDNGTGKTTICLLYTSTNDRRFFMILNMKRSILDDLIASECFADIAAG